MQKIAIEELAEVPHRIPDDIQTLKNWIRLQPHLKARTEDQFLVQFLRGSKYSLEKAKKKIDYFFALKSKCPELFGLTNVDDPDFRRFHNVKSVFVLPNPLKGCGPRIFMSRFTFGPEEFSAPDVLRYGTALNEIAIMSDPYACIYGTIFLLDFDKATIAHLMIFTPSLVKKIIKFFESSLPLRIKGVFIINLSSYALSLFTMLLQYAPEKLRSRIYLCGTDTSVLEEQLPRKYFPVEYGGENGSLDQLCQDFNKVWDEYREYFKQNAEYGTDESLRLGKKIDFDDDLGIGGSFRKLDVD
ncbi:alpha-tocopherol transfer protein-like isoform X3 [Haematobia irritans]|uniref:alpha-tocopherol transfer protein-like isoform X3 n=1 Tax=Haematobia irritans TaxID=7368 RepID=UPI003F4FA1C5